MNGPHPFSCRLTLTITCWVLAGIQLDSFAQGTPSQGNPSLLQGLVEELVPGANVPPTTSKPPPTQAKKSDKKSANTGKNDGDPLQAIQLDLLASAQRLTRGQINDQTIQLQSEILARMNEMIDAIVQSDAQMNPSSTNSKSGSKSAETNNTNTGEKSTVRKSGTSRTQEDLERELSEGADSSSGTGLPDSNAGRLQSSTNIQPENLSSELLQSGAWGNLPERVRREMQSAPTQKFLPAFQKRIEDYYRRLAEEKVKPR